MQQMMCRPFRVMTFFAVVLFAFSATAKNRSEPRPVNPPPDTAPPVVAIEGGRRLEFVRAFSSEKDAKGKRSTWTKVLDFIAGPPEFHRMVRPYSVARDSHGRLVVTDPGASAVHIFDFDKKKYVRLTGGHHENFKSPQCVALDAHDNIYVTDSELGKVFVFDSGGKFRRLIGGLKNGEGYFKRPTGIAVDSAADRIYITDTLRNKIFTLDLQGNVLGNFGERGFDSGQFNFPTEVALRGDELVVVDAMNFRVQAFDRSGKFLWKFGAIGNETGAMFRPKGLGFDSEGSIYVVDGVFENVQVFDRTGQLLYFFGHSGTGPAEFQLPAGLFIDSENRIYVADSYNHRVQVFQFTAAARGRNGGQP
jgi:DNA-binding beta-propeller fold protein YncE